MPRIKDMKERDLRKLIRKASTILEDRRDDLDYETIYKTKGRGKNKVETDEIEFLTVELRGHESAKFTRLAEKYFEANEALKKAQMERDALSDKIKELTAPLWDITDRVHQRLMTTISYGFMLTKETPAGEKGEVDYEGVTKDLIEALDIQKSLLDEIVEKNTKIKKTKATPERLREPSAAHKKFMKKRGVGKRQVEESVSLSDVKDKLQSWFDSFVSLADRYLGVVDNKLQEIDRKLA